MIIEFFLPNFLFSIKEAAIKTGKISNKVESITFKMSFEEEVYYCSFIILIENENLI